MNDAMVTSIRTAFDGWGAAWNNGDLEGYLEGYWDSEQTRYVSNAQVVRGKAAIVAGYRSRFPRSEALGTLALQHIEVEAIGEQDALIFGVMAHTLDETTREVAFTVHVRQIDGTWRIVSDHSAA